MGPTVFLYQSGSNIHPHPDSRIYTNVLKTGPVTEQKKLPVHDSLVGLMSMISLSMISLQIYRHNVVTLRCFKREPIIQQHSLPTHGHETSSHKVLFPKKQLWPTLCSHGRLSDFRSMVFQCPGDDRAKSGDNEGKQRQRSSTK